ncbi:MAG: threonylcarbamoyl-AMP synthase [Bacteroidales bacterium]|nr:threonylcarbamoyl-AMP synthase [Bacteroidales bacterium]
MKEVLTQTVEVLQRGGIILYPTDTVWGIGCDATNAEAVARVLELKQRSEAKGLIVLVDTSARIDRYVDDVPDIAYDLIDLATSPLTVVFDRGKNLASNLLPADGSVAIRVVQHEFCRRLVERLGRPLVSTSANVAGGATPRVLAEVDERIVRGVDMVVPEQFHCPVSSRPSGVVAVQRGGVVRVIRE